MPINPTYPGVYIEEIPSGSHTITGVATSIGAFVDFFPQGPLNEAVQIFSIADFERAFGGLDVRSEASYGIQQFFLNGGSEAYVVRASSISAANAAVLAAIVIQDGTGNNVLLASAATPGQWGNNLRIGIDYGTTDPARLFNLAVTEVSLSGGTAQVVASETFRNLSLDSTQSNFAVQVVNNQSELITLKLLQPISPPSPAQSGTTSNDFPGIGYAWASKTNFAQGAIIVDSNGNYEQASAVLGTTGANAPTWPTSPGATVADGTVTWQLMPSVSVRKPSTPYTVGTYATDPNGNLQRVTIAGTSTTAALSGALTWAPAVGGTSIDGSVTWTLVSKAATSIWVKFTNTSQGSVINDGANWEMALSVLGTSGTTVPAAWPTVPGTTVADTATVTWKLLPTGIGILPTWAAGKAYKVGDKIMDSNGNLERVSAAGTSGAAPPIWPTTLAGTVVEAGSTLTWTLSNANALAVNLGSSMTVMLSSNAALSSSTIAFNSSSVVPPPTPTWSWLASTFQSLIRKLDPSLANATVGVVGSASTLAGLQIKPGTSNPADFMTFTDVAGTGGFASALGIATAANVNVQQYALGSSQSVKAQALPGFPGAAQSGGDGIWDPVNDSTGIAAGLIGDPLLKTGIYALLDVDLFNILCIPATAFLTDTAAAQVIAYATALCVQERAFYIVDVPQATANRDSVPAITSWLDGNASLRSRNAAIYFPRSKVADPLNNSQLRPTGQSGTIAGLYARTDVARGVWKAPAGTEATLAGVQELEYNLIDGENGVLNPLAINCLRNFPVYGMVSWGGRTLYGADQMEDDYKYIPVRRLALFLEESLYRGTQWVVFEPNDEPLWAQVRASVTTFMQDLFKQGAFQGSTPQAAYLVRCDSETTTSSDQNKGIVNITVGFAPLKPAEFVIIQIQQLAGQVS